VQRFLPSGLAGANAGRCAGLPAAARHYAGASRALAFKSPALRAIERSKKDTVCASCRGQAHCAVARPALAFKSPALRAI